jgi:hypothetical protein
VILQQIQFHPELSVIVWLAKHSSVAENDFGKLSIQLTTYGIFKNCDQGGCQLGVLTSSKVNYSPVKQHQGIRAIGCFLSDATSETAIRVEQNRKILDADRSIGIPRQF